MLSSTHLTQATGLGSVHTQQRTFGSRLQQHMTYSGMVKPIRLMIASVNSKPQVPHASGSCMRAIGYGAIQGHT